MTSISIHDVTSVTTKQASNGNTRWTEILIQTKEGTHEIVLFPAGELPIDEDLSQVRELGSQPKYSA